MICDDERDLPKLFGQALKNATLANRLVAIAPARLSSPRYRL